MIKKSFLVFYKNKLLPIFSIIATLLIVGGTSAYGAFLTKGTENTSEITNDVPLYFFMIMLNTAVLFFTVVIFLSYTYFSRAKHDSIEECISQMPNGLLKLRFSQIIVMLCVVFAMTLPFFIEVIVFYFLFAIKYVPLLMYMLKGVFVFFTLSGITGVFVASGISLIKNRFLPYFLMIIMVVLNLDFSVNWFSNIYRLIGIDLSRFGMLFRTTPMGLLWTINVQTGISIQWYQIASILFLIFISALIVFYSSSKGKDLKRIATVAICGICTILSLIFVFLPASTMTRFPVGKDDDLNYYSKIEEQQEQKPNFQVTQYDMRMKIGRLLSADITMTVDKNNLPEYTMTLYHGYKVHKVMDENKKALDFSQEGDKLTIQNPNTVNKIQIKYKGQSNNFYSNTQAVYLPASFPYYPQPGFKKIFGKNNIEVFTKNFLDNEPQFNVSVSKSGKKIYSSIDGENGSFSGKSDGLTLISGFLGTIDIDGKEVIYPLLSESTNVNELKKNVSSYSKFIENYEQINKIILIPNVVVSQNRETTYSFSDHLISTIYSSDSVERAYVNQKIPDSKIMLKNYIDWYADIGEDELKHTKNANINEQGTFYELYNVLPRKELEQLCTNFMFNDSDKRNYMEFIVDLAKEKGVRK